MKYQTVFILIWSLVFCTSCGSNQTELPKDNATPESKEPSNITRSLIQAKNGDIWIAAFDGVFRYDGKAFSNITSKVSSARFFSILEDRKGIFWFGSIGFGVYAYDGKTFRNFTTYDGLVSNEIVSIYEDKIGNIWFGANGGVSCYDGKTFRNFIIDEDTMIADTSKKPSINFTPKEKHSGTGIEVNAIIEDQKGQFWFATRGHTFIYDGKTFTTVTHHDKPFTNVRWVIEDKKGNIWLGGQDGLWRYDGNIFVNITKDFVGYIYEDKSGNIWTSSQNMNNRRWVLSRYSENSLSNKKPIVTEITSEHEGNKGMIFGILEGDNGGVWFGGLDGVYRYDGSLSYGVGQRHIITDFKNKSIQN